MQIIWKGHSCFQIITQTGKNNQVYLVIDPFEESIGLKAPKLEADILLITHSHFDHNNRNIVSSPLPGQKPFIIDNPGEYDIKNIFIQGIYSYHDEKEGKERGSNSIYVIEAEDLKVCHLGDLGQKELTDDQVEKIGEIDVLMIPVGGTYTINAREATKIISQIEPRVIIPMHYQVPKLKIKLEGVEVFLKEMGIKSFEAQNKLLIKKKDLALKPTNGADVVILKN